MATLERAIAIAAEAHAGQTDKAGEPYILHPLRMINRFSLLSEERIVCVLHDVVEDCPAWTLDRLRGEGFSPSVIEALDAITRRESEAYNDYLDRVCANFTATVAKLADLRDNTSDQRRHQLSDGMLHRYALALNRIKESAIWA